MPVKRLQKWKEHFKNLFGNLPVIINKPMKKIYDCQLVIKLEQFIEEEFDARLKELEAEKLQISKEYPLENGRQKI